MKFFLKALMVIIFCAFLPTSTKVIAQDFDIPPEIIDWSSQRAHIDNETAERILSTVLHETAVALSEGYEVEWDYRLGSFFVCSDEDGERDVCFIPSTLKEIEDALEKTLLIIAEDVEFANSDLSASIEKADQIWCDHVQGFIAYMYVLYEEFYNDLPNDSQGKIAKADLEASVAKISDVNQTTVEKALNGFLNALNAMISKGDTVTLVGFGTFKKTKRQSRVGRNPQTGETIRIPAKKVPGFKAGKALKDFVK